MTIHELAALIGTGILGLLASFQILLAAGLPLGAAAWGGRHRVLPRGLRFGSLAAAGILAVAAWMLLARSGLVVPGGEPLVVRIVAWVFAGYFGLNVLMNLTSKSRLERIVMTPTSVLLAACYLIVTIS
ncbi:hypothetical protein ACFLTM_00130 [Candidatus Bipolaricaulota bacterium]